MIDPFTGSLPSELYPPPPGKRADTLAIKQTIADSMSETDGLTYWNTLVKFLKGKLDRKEFESHTDRLLKSERLVGLHNALILSILYNTTQIETPPIHSPNRSNPSTTGHGWHKRKRIPPAPVPPKVKVKTEEKDPKKRKLKEAVMALGQRERDRLKQIAISKEKELEQIHKQQNSQPSDLLKQFSCHYLCQERAENVMNTPLSSKMKISSSTLHQDYMRCQQALLCSESKQLPDFDGLKDRMSLIAYDSGLVNGVDKAASSLALIALEVHLKTLLGDLLSLIRPDRSVATTNESEPQLNNTTQHTHGLNSNASWTEPPVASTSARPYSPSNNLNSIDTNSMTQTKPATISLANQAFQASSNLRLRDLKTQGLAPHLTSRDVTALAEISPHAFVRAHPAALDRLIATHNSSEPNSSEEEEGVNQVDHQHDFRRPTHELGGTRRAGYGKRSIRALQRTSSRNQFINRTLGSSLSRANAFSPHGDTRDNLNSKSDMLSRHKHYNLGASYSSNRSLLDRFRAVASNGSTNQNGSLDQTNTRNPSIRPELRINPRLSVNGTMDCQSPNLSGNQSHQNSPHGLNGPNRSSPVFSHHPFQSNDQRRSSAAHPVKTLTAELFPEEDFNRHQAFDNHGPHQLRNGGTHQYKQKDSQNFIDDDGTARDGDSASDSDEDDGPMAIDGPILTSSNINSIDQTRQQLSKMTKSNGGPNAQKQTDPRTTNPDNASSQDLPPNSISDAMNINDHNKNPAGGHHRPNENSLTSTTSTTVIIMNVDGANSSNTHSSILSPNKNSHLGIIQDSNPNSQPPTTNHQHTLQPIISSTMNNHVDSNLNHTINHHHRSINQQSLHHPHPPASSSNNSTHLPNDTNSNSNHKKKSSSSGWDRIDTFRLLENIGN